MSQANNIFVHTRPAEDKGSKGCSLPHGGSCHPCKRPLAISAHQKGRSLLRAINKKTENLEKEWLSCSQSPSNTTCLLEDALCSSLVEVQFGPVAIDDRSRQIGAKDVEWTVLYAKMAGSFHVQIMSSPLCCT